VYCIKCRAIPFGIISRSPRLTRLFCDYFVLLSFVFVFVSVSGRKSNVKSVFGQSLLCKICRAHRRLRHLRTQIDAGHKMSGNINFVHVDFAWTYRCSLLTLVENFAEIAYNNRTRDCNPGIPGSRTVFQSRNPGIMRDQIPGFRD